MKADEFLLGLFYFAEHSQSQLREAEIHQHKIASLQLCGAVLTSAEHV
jgi:hypothetical protein